MHTMTATEFDKEFETYMRTAVAPVTAEPHRDMTMAERQLCTVPSQLCHVSQDGECIYKVTVDNDEVYVSLPRWEELQWWLHTPAETDRGYSR